MAIKEYTTSTESGPSSALNDAKQAISDVTSGVTSTIGSVVDVAQDALYAVKLVLAETGVWKQIAKNGGATTTQTPGNASSDIKQKTGDKETYSQATVLRNDITKDYHLGIGDYLMPLSFNISISGSKQVANSQLVDGINIIERIANLPKQINISFRLESKATQISADTIQSSNSTFDIALNTQLKEYNNSMTAIDVTTKAAAELNMLFGDLANADTVFEIVNPILNNTFNIFNVILLSYNVEPITGTTMWNVSLALEEVNITQTLLYVANSDGKQTQISTKAGDYGG